MKIFATLLLEVLFGIIMGMIWLMSETKFKQLKERRKPLFAIILFSLIGVCAFLIFLQNYADKLNFAGITVSYPIFVGNEVSVPSNRIGYGYALLLTFSVLAAPFAFDILPSKQKKNNDTENPSHSALHSKIFETTMLCVILLMAYKNYIDGYWDDFQTGWTLYQASCVGLLITFFISALFKPEPKTVWNIIHKISIAVLCYISLASILMA